MGTPEVELDAERPLGAVRASVERARTSIDAAAKRLLDFVVAGILLVLLAPLFVALGLLIKLESAGPVFYGAERVGQHGVSFRLLKLRKMHDGAAGEALTADVDARFTRIGRYLARTKLDELPQLLNVLRGQMSLVGPRPEDPRFVRRHDNDFAEIHRVRPGITGLGQLAFAREAEILDPTDRVGCYIDRILPQKVHIDLLYARTRSMRVDLRILAWTIVPVLLRREVAVNRRTGRLTVRRRAEDGSTSCS